MGQELVDDAGYEGRFRADDGEVGFDGQVVGGRDVGRDLRGSGVAWGAQNLVTFKGEAPGEGMLTPSASNDEDFQFIILSRFKG
jgi:hypothetical protein